MRGGPGLGEGHQDWHHRVTRHFSCTLQSDIGKYLAEEQMAGLGGTNGIRRNHLRLIALVNLGGFIVIVKSAPRIAITKEALEHLHCL